MRADQPIATYRRMRKQPLWQLLASVNGPIVIGLLQTHLYEKERNLPASILFERLQRDIEELRSQGDELPQSAQAYVAGWLKEGYLERRYPPGASEEEYELSTAAVEAIRFLTSIAKPHSAATESRLTLVIQALTGLAEDTDADQTRRIERLKAEKERIENDIEAIQKGKMRIISDESALERVREIISLADELTGDFRRVRDEFKELNQELRERIMDSEGNRGEVLDSLFVGYDLIAESKAGRTFLAFWSLLTDPEQKAMLEDSLDNVISRQFASELDRQERRFLLDITRNLLEQGGTVHEVLQTFSRSLRHFVQSRDYLEQQRVNQLLKEAQRGALAIKQKVRTSKSLDYNLIMTSSKINSLSRWVLHDPRTEAEPRPMHNSESAPLDLELISNMVAMSEIDFRTLKLHILNLLEQQDRASIAEVLDQFPAEQGLGSVVGLLALGSHHGIQGDVAETVAWTGQDAQQRRARIPKIYFLRERLHELA